MASIVLDDVSVDFPIYGAQRSFRKVFFERATGGLLAHGARDRIVVKALSKISLSLKDGDRIGLVGHNGAGKSTLLKVLAGVYEPVSGRIVIDGRVTPLFDTLPGLDPEDSGYRNVISAGMLFGLSRSEVESLLPEIEAFSELGEYFGLPVRTYSLGMMTRLGFSFVTAMHPGILLIDEGIGAGDARFADRAAKRLTEFVSRSQIVVLASHSDPLIRSMCNKAALLESGRLLAIGEVEDILEQYAVFVRDGHLSAAPADS
jgi:ABC-type polysaccharide/polyol phosphate transport system ATPase subunit